MASGRSRNFFLFCLLGVLLAAFFLLDIWTGSVRIPMGQVFDALTGRGADPMVETLVRTFRVPKALAALAAGTALAASGLQMQTLFRNPLAGPYILGVSSGASLGVSLFLLGIPVLGLGAGAEWLRNIGLTGAAWIGGAAILGIIFVVSVRVRDIMALLILGMMIGSGATAVVSILQYLSPEGALKSFMVWTMGNLGGVSVSQLKILLPFTAAGLALSVRLIKPLNLLLLGEAYARTMGQHVRRVRMLIFCSTVLLAGTVTAFCGPIGYVGNAVPHMARMLFRDADHRVLMPASILIGGLVMLVCDVVSQLPGTETVLPVNTVTALVGIPVVVNVILKNRKLTGSW